MIDIVCSVPGVLSHSISTASSISSKAFPESTLSNQPSLTTEGEQTFCRSIYLMTPLSPESLLRICLKIQRRRFVRLKCSDSDFERASDNTSTGQETDSSGFQSDEGTDASRYSIMSPSDVILGPTRRGRPSPAPTPATTTSDCTTLFHQPDIRRGGH